MAHLAYMQHKPCICIYCAKGLSLICMCLFFAVVLVNELNDLPYLSAVGDLDEAELQEQDVTCDTEILSNGVLPTSTQGTDSFDNPFLRPAKRARKVAKPS